MERGGSCVHGSTTRGTTNGVPRSFLATCGWGVRQNRPGMSQRGFSRTQPEVDRKIPDLSTPFSVPKHSAFFLNKHVTIPLLFRVSRSSTMLIEIDCMILKRKPIWICRIQPEKVILFHEEPNWLIGEPNWPIGEPGYGPFLFIRDFYKVLAIRPRFGAQRYHFGGSAVDFFFEKKMKKKSSKVIHVSQRTSFHAKKTRPRLGTWGGT